MLCGATFLAGLVSLGLCLVVFWIYVLAGVLLAGLGVPCFGRWCLFVFFGLFGGREIIGVLRTWKALWKRFSPLCCIPCIRGLRLICLLCTLVMPTFFPAFLFLARSSSCIYPMYFWGAYAF
jgi:hypothetical protein